MACSASSPFCRPEEDPFLLLESSHNAIEWILQQRRGLPLRRTWIAQPYGEEEFTLLEEELLPDLAQVLKRVDAIDQKQEHQQREAEQVAAGEGALLNAG